jgi:hypothetical protein
MPHLVRLLGSIKIQTPAEPHEFIVSFGVHVIDRITKASASSSELAHGQPAVRAEPWLAGWSEGDLAWGTEWRWRRRAILARTNGIVGGRPVRFSSDLRHGAGRGTRVVFIAAKTS